MTFTHKTLLGAAAAAMLLIAGAVAEDDGGKKEHEHGKHSKSAGGPDMSKLPPVAATHGVTFAKDIQPLFTAACVSCHGPDKAKGDIRLDSLEATLKGGKDGKIVTVGDSAKSVLVVAVSRLDPENAMPRPAKRGGEVTPLTADQVGLIRAWIDQGAK